MPEVPPEDAEQQAWQRMRAAILRCQAESAASETGEPTEFSRAQVARERTRLVSAMEANTLAARRVRDRVA